MNKTSPCQKIVLAALMLGTHEMAAIVTALPLILKSEEQERAEWLTIFVSLLTVYVFSYAVNWKFNIAEALSVGIRPNPLVAVSSFATFLANPYMGLLAIFIAYKLYWIPIFLGWKRRTMEQHLMVGCVLVTLPFILIASDVSRLTQFSSIALFFVLSEELAGWTPTKRNVLAVVNLIIPSFYLATNTLLPLWGPGGLYSLYLEVGIFFGMDWGSLFR